MRALARPLPVRLSVSSGCPRKFIDGQDEGSPLKEPKHSPSSFEGVAERKFGKERKDRRDVGSLQVDFRKLSRSGRPKYSSGSHAALNASASAASGGVFSASAAAAHAASSQPSTSNGTPGTAAQQSST